MGEEYQKVLIPTYLKYIEQEKEVQVLKKSRDYSRSVCESQSKEIESLKEEIKSLKLQIPNT